MLRKVYELPSDLVVIPNDGRAILAFGEATGHHHSFSNAVLYAPTKDAPECTHVEIANIAERSFAQNSADLCLADARDFVNGQPHRKTVFCFLDQKLICRFVYVDWQDSYAKPSSFCH